MMFLAPWTGSVEALQGFLAHLDCFYPSIQLTLEIGGVSISFPTYAPTLKIEFVSSKSIESPPRQNLHQVTLGMK